MAQANGSAVQTLKTSSRAGRREHDRGGEHGVGLRSRRHAQLTLLILSGVLGCQGREMRSVDRLDSSQASTSPGESRAAVDRPDLPGFCRRAGDDAIRDAFCGAQAPVIGGLRDLQELVGIRFDAAAYGSPDEAPTVPADPEASLVVLNTSTALSGRVVSTLNPRAIMLAREVTLAFSRGVQQIELVSRDRDDRRLKFYLVRFEQACNAEPGGCSPGDLYTPRVEADWTALEIMDDEALKNTASDCRQCHQRAREEPMLLMRELDGPWTHFFQLDVDSGYGSPEASGVDILRAYHAAKSDEPYGNVPWTALRATVGLTLQNVVDRPQPLVFDGQVFLNERWPYDRKTGFADAPVSSPRWYREYEAFKRGEHLALPHFDPFPTDSGKLAALGDAYRAFLSGELDASELPDLGDIYPDDAQTRAEIGLQTEPGATPAQAIVQACGSCHNDRLDQSLSRARFNIDLSRMERAALDRAIERIQLPLDAPGHMPPREFRQLDADGVQPLIEYLRGDLRTEEDDAFLRQAAELGMSVELTSFSYSDSLDTITGSR